MGCNNGLHAYQVGVDDEACEGSKAVSRLQTALGTPPAPLAFPSPSITQGTALPCPLCVA